MTKAPDFLKDESAMSFALGECKSYIERERRSANLTLALLIVVAAVLLAASGVTAYLDSRGKNTALATIMNFRFSTAESASSYPLDPARAELARPSSSLPTQESDPEPLPIAVDDLDLTRTSPELIDANDFGLQLPTRLNVSTGFFAAFVLAFSMLFALHRFHVGEIAKFEHYRIGFIRSHIAGSSERPDAQIVVQQALVTNAFDYQKPSFWRDRRQKAVENPAPGHPMSDTAIAVANSLIDAIESRLGKSASGDDH